MRGRLESYEEGESRGKSGDQPHNLGEDWERGQPSGQGPALRLEWTCIGTCVCVCMCMKEEKREHTHSLERQRVSYVWARGWAPLRSLVTQHVEVWVWGLNILGKP